MVEAYVMVKIEPGTNAKVLEELEGKPGIIDVKEAYGEYDIIIHIEAESNEELRKKVYGMRNIKEIRDTTTMIVTDRK